MSALAPMLPGLAGDELSDALDARGYAIVRSLLSPAECAAIAERYDEAPLYRKTVVMRRHGFGSGEYRYFADPLPAPIAALQGTTYERLAPIANAWWERLGMDARFPPTHAELRARCEDAGQALPTPLLLRYVPGDYNRLHQDLYGDVWFPLQLAVLLDEPGRDFEGGEFVLVEQRARMQSRPIVVPLQRGDAVVFPCHHRPVASGRGHARVVMRHGVAEVTRGTRRVLGIIFHSART